MDNTDITKAIPTQYDSPDNLTTIRAKWRNISKRILEKLAIAAQRTDTPTEFRIDKEMRIYPSADVFYSFIHSDKVIFAEQMSSIMNEKINTADLEVKSQVIMAAAADFNETTVRLDVRGTNPNWLMASEMQNDPRKSLTDDRSPYYHAVLMASQEVDNMQYDKLKTVCITFIMPTKELKDSDGIRHLEWADVNTGKFIENSDRRYFLYVPNILKNEKIKSNNSKLYMFARFYEILTQEQANAFLKNYQNDPIARRMIHMSNVLYEEKVNVQEINTIPYYDRRVFVEEIAKLEEKNRKNKQKIRKIERHASGMLKLLLTQGLSTKVIAESLGTSEIEVKKLLSDPPETIVSTQEK